MFRQRLLFFRTVLLATDLVLIALVWLFAYHLRLISGLIPVWKGVPPLYEYIFPLLYLMPIWGVVGVSLGLYSPRRTFALWDEGWLLAKAASLTLVCFTATSYVLKQVDISRMVLAIFWVAAITLPLVSRALIPHTVRHLRRKGTYLRRALVVGHENLAHEVIKTIQQHPEAGLTIVGIAAESPHLVGTRLDGIEVLGTPRAVGAILQQARIDQLIVALPFRTYEVVEDVLAQVENEPVEVMLSTRPVALPLAPLWGRRSGGDSSANLARGPIVWLERGAETRDRRWRIVRRPGTVCAAAGDDRAPDQMLVPWACPLPTAAHGARLPPVYASKISFDAYRRGGGRDSYLEHKERRALHASGALAQATKP